MTITAASMFSGIGGAELALPQARWLWCAEIEPFPSAVLAQRLGHPNLGDVSAADFVDRAIALGPLDLLCGGPPCQAFSVAGLRKGMRDPRGALSITFIEVAHELADRNGLRNALIENVPGWLSHDENAFGCFLGALVGADDALLPCERPPAGRNNDFWRWRAAGTYPVLDDDGEPTGDTAERPACHIPSWPRAGMAAGPRARVAWRVLDAQYSGLAQRRQRVFLVADFGNGADPAAVLFEPGGVRGDRPTRGEAGQGLAGTLSARTQGGGGLGTDFECQGGLQAEYLGNAEGGATDAPFLTCSNIGKTVNNQTPLIGEIAHTLRSEGFDASEDGTGRGTPIVPELFSIMPMNSGRDYKARRVDIAQPVMADGQMLGNQGGDVVLQPVAFSCKDYGADATDDLSPTLRAMGHGDSHANAGGQMAIAEPITIMERGRNGAPNLEWRQDGTANAILTPNGGRGGLGVGAIAFDTTQITSPQNGCNPQPSDPCHPLAASAHVPPIATQWAVRRLTVRECERLQGYPDGWTLIEHGNRRTLPEDEARYLADQGAAVVLGNDGKWRTNAAADGPRYRALGNAWAVACVRPIAKRLHDLLTGGAG